MPRSRKLKETREQRLARQAAEEAATEALRAQLYDRLVLHAKRLGLEELKRRLRERGISDQPIRRPGFDPDAAARSASDNGASAPCNPYVQHVGLDHG